MESMNWYNRVKVTEEEGAKNQKNTKQQTRSLQQFIQTSSSLLVQDELLTMRMICLRLHRAFARHIAVDAKSARRLPTTKMPPRATAAVALISRNFSRC